MMVDNNHKEKQGLLAPELKTRRIELALFITRYTQWAMLAVASIVFISWLLLPQFPQLLIYALVVAIMGAISAAYRFFVNRGMDYLGGLLYLSWFILLTAVCLVLIPDLIASAVICYVFVTLLSNIFLGQRGFLAFMSASLLLFASNIFYIYHPESYWFSELPYNLGPIFGVITGGLAFLVLSLYIRKIILNQEALFVASNAAKREIEKKAAQEHARSTLIQQTVIDYVDMMTSVSKGNLAVRIPIDERDNTGEDPLVSLGLQINHTIASLETMIQQTGEASANLSSSAAEILAAVSQQASGTSEQSAAITQTNTTLQEVRTIAEQATQRAQEVVTAAQQAAQVSRTGQEAVRATIDGMSQIRARVESISFNILALSEQTQKIGDIITTVNDLSSQSNMLALNAAVEAARAGEQGKGFSVVASEVRSLAEQSKQATAQVKGILQEIQKATNASVMATEEGIKVVEQGVQLAERTQETIEQLVGVMNESVNRMLQVKAGGQQQATGMEQVSLAMANIQQVSLQSLASTRQAEQSAQDLNQLAARLNQTLAHYDQKDAAQSVDFAVARLNHKNWVKRLSSFMEGKTTLTAEAVVSHRDCDLGKWLYATALVKYSTSPEIKELEQIHEAFHNNLKQVVRLKQAGQDAKAESEMLAIQQITERIFALLSIAEKRDGHLVHGKSPHGN